MARNRAIAQAVRGLVSRIMPVRKKPMLIIIDGKFSKAWLERLRPEGTIVQTLINRDEKVYEISAASIIARIYADALFEGFGKFYPGYNMEKNHGSPDKTMY